MRTSRPAAAARLTTARFLLRSAWVGAGLLSTSATFALLLASAPHHLGGTHAVWPLLLPGWSATALLAWADIVLAAHLRTDS